MRILWIAAGIGLFLFVRYFGDEIADVVRGTPTEAEIETALLASPAADAYSAIKEYFPDEARQWRQRMIELEMKRRQGDYDQWQGIAVGAEIRQSLAGHLEHAPDSALRAVLGYQIAVHEVFEDDPEVCARFLMQGPSGLSSTELERLEPLIAQGGIMYRAMHAGATSPVTWSASTDEDWQRFYTHFINGDLGNAHFDLLIQPDPADPLLCDAFLGYFRKAQSASFEGAGRIRAELVAAIGAS